MDEMISFEKALRLPEEILNISSNNVYLALYPQKEYGNFNFVKARKTIIDRIDKFSVEMHFYNLSVEDLVKITPLYELREGYIPRNISKPTESVALRVAKTQEYVNNFYNAMIRISRIINPEEAVYLVEGLFSKKTEELVAEKLNICPATLKKVKHSCIYKIWPEFSKLDD